MVGITKGKLEKLFAKHITGQVTIEEESEFDKHSRDIVKDLLIPGFEIN